MKLHQAFSVSLPIEQKISDHVRWSEIDPETHYYPQLRMAHPQEEKKSIKKEAINDTLATFYFPIDQYYKKIIMTTMEFKAPKENKMESSDFSQTRSDEILGNWLESCNILLGTMLTKVEQELFDQSQLNLFSPLKTVPINFKLSEFDFFGARTWHHFDIVIPTSFFLWELQKEKYHHLVTPRSVYDLDNR